MVMESLERLDPPQSLGKLTLLARLGEGGMATVYVAAVGQGTLARLCAVKLLRAGVPDQDYRTRFLDEAKLVVRLQEAGQLYIVMELCEGRDLADVWDRCAEVGRAFPVPLAVHIVREALRGLHYAHTFPGLQLVHRDVSPSNLLVDWNGAVRVADFGLATSALKATATIPGLVFGKVGYMAPEQATRSDLDGRADVYSCGVVLWELLTGRPLREAGIDTRAVARFAPRAPSELSRRVDPELDALVVRALSTKPVDRWLSAMDFMRGLADWLSKNAPETNQETLAEFMRALFGDTRERDHEAYGALLENLSPTHTAVFTRAGEDAPREALRADELQGEVGAPTRELATPPTDPEDIPAATVVAARYRIENKLGQGGMGTVYLAEHVTVGRKVAVKVLTREWSRHPIVARRFQEEARAASAAGHPNIVEVFDAGELPDGRLFLVMEYLVGRSLYEELCQEGPMPVARAVPLIREVARAIGAAHKVGIIHRDLKPDNVMIVRRGGEDRVKVLDFGISTSAVRPEEDRRLTQPGHALGTPEYMAPEQAKGMAPTERFDIYALGVMLYEMLGGEPPFCGDNMIEVLTRKAVEPAPPLDRVRPELPPKLVALVHACIEIRAEDRPYDIREFIARLDAAVAPEREPTVVALAPLDVAARTREVRTVNGGAMVRVPRAAMSSARLPRAQRRLAAGVGVGAVALFAALLWWRSLPGSEPATASASTPDDGLTAVIEPAASESSGSGQPLEPQVEPVPPKPVPVVPVPDVVAPDLVTPAVVPAKTIAKPNGKRPPAADSPACVATRAEAQKARQKSDWSAVLARVGETRCWAGVHRNARLALRVRALFETKRFAECASAGRSAKTAEVRALAEACAKRAGS
jgi:serine/threonine protein kinase